MTVDTADGIAGITGADDSALQLMLAMHRLVRNVRRSAGIPGLHPTQVLVLAQLVEAGPQRIGELAAKVPCSQPTATSVANNLEEQGLVQRLRDTSDGRAIRLSVTEAGQAALLDVVRNQAGQLRERLDALTPEEQTSVMAAVPVLRKMATNE